MIEKSCGPIPSWMANKADNKLDKHFDIAYNKNNSYFDWPKYASDKKSFTRVKEMLTIKDIVLQLGWIF